MVFIMKINIYKDCIDILIIRADNSDPEGDEVTPPNNGLSEWGEVTKKYLKNMSTYIFNEFLRHFHLSVLYAS